MRTAQIGPDLRLGEVLHKQRFSGIDDFLSLTAKLLKILFLRYCLMMIFS